MTGRGGSIAPPVMGPVLQAFIDSRRVRPWPSNVTGSVRAGRLYESYVEAANEAGLTSYKAVRFMDEPLLSSRDFGLALREAGYYPTKDGDGYHVYSGMFDITREDMARFAAIEVVAGKEERRLWDEAEEEHDRTTDHGFSTVPIVYERGVVRHPDAPDTEDIPNGCTCPPNEVMRLLRPQVEAALDAYIAEHEDDIARVIEERFGPFLRWREGDDEADIEAWYVARDARIRRQQLNALRKVESQLAEARADKSGSLAVERSIEPLARDRRELREDLDLPDQYSPGHVRTVRPPDGWKWDRYVDGGPDLFGYVTEVPES